MNKFVNSRISAIIEGRGFHPFSHQDKIFLVEDQNIMHIIHDHVAPASPAPGFPYSY